MKPDWEKDAPPWATHLAMDSDGEWHWHSKKPKLLSTVWFPYGKNVRTELAGRSEPEWENSLEKRPDPIPDPSEMILSNPADDRIGKWLSAALSDPAVCEEMKRDIRNWFEHKEWINYDA